MRVNAPGDKRRQVASGVVHKRREEFIIREGTMRVIAPVLFFGNITLNAILAQIYAFFQ